MTSEDSSHLGSIDPAELPITAAARDHLIATKAETGEFPNDSLASVLLGTLEQLERRIIALENRS